MAPQLLRPVTVNGRVYDPRDPGHLEALMADSDEAAIDRDILVANGHLDLGSDTGSDTPAEPEDADEEDEDEDEDTGEEDEGEGQSLDSPPAGSVARNRRTARR